ncbi:MAG: NAD(P)-dependent oxidoreductase [Algibacter sp.]
MNEKVIITGATGFVGSNLSRELINKNFDVYIIVRENSGFNNISDFIDKVKLYKYNGKVEDLIIFFKEVRPIGVFHLASNFIAEHNYNQVDSLIDSNILFGVHLLEAMKESGVKKIINTGTSWQHYNNEDYNPVCLYAATKQAFEALLEYYVHAEGFKVITLKLYDTYGENDSRPKLINLLNQFADDNTELNMSPGNQLLNLVHVSDVCKAFFVAWELIKSNDKYEHKCYTVSSEKEYNLKELIKLFETSIGKSIKVNWGGKSYRKREVMNLWNSGEKLPNWSAQITLEEGLKRYCKKE